MKGIECKLFRIDGTNKRGIVQLTPDEKYLVGKKKGGEEKSKYKLDVSQITDYKYNYKQDNKGSQPTVFYKGGGMFTKAPVAERCITIYGPI